MWQNHDAVIRRFDFMCMTQSHGASNGITGSLFTAKTMQE